MTFSDILLKSFSENLKKLTEIAKTNHFSIFLHFSRKSRIWNCFHCRYEFCMQKYPNKHIFVETMHNYFQFYQRLNKTTKNLKTTFYLFVFFAI